MSISFLCLRKIREESDGARSKIPLNRSRERKCFRDNADDAYEATAFNDTNGASVNSMATADENRADAGNLTTRPRFDSSLGYRKIRI